LIIAFDYWVAELNRDIRTMAQTTAHTSSLRKLCNRAAGLIVNIIAAAAQIYSEPIYFKIPYHTSILTGEGWVQELLDGHPLCIKTELGMQHHVVCKFVQALVHCRLKPSKHISNEEQVAIFLYASITGLSIRHLGEQFPDL
jgi:hypothetical protein